MRPAVRLLLAGLLFGLPWTAWAWRYDLRGPGDDFPTALASTPGGDVVVAATLGGRIGLLRLRGTDGSLVWRREPDRGRARASGILDARDDVVVAEEDVLLAGDEFIRHAVLGLSAPTGEELWRDTAARTSDTGFATVDGRGNVFIARTGRGTLAEPARTEVRKVERATGRETWRYTEERLQTVSFTPVAVDPRGDLMVGGNGVLKLDGETGMPVWNTTIPFDRYVSRLGTDATGNVVFQTRLAFAEIGDHEDVVTKLAAADGSILWTRQGRSNQAMTLLTLDSGGNAIIGTIRGGLVGEGLHASWRATLMQVGATDGNQRGWG